MFTWCTLADTKRHCCNVEKEVLAIAIILFWSETLRSYNYGQHFYPQMDHKPLTILLSIWSQTSSLSDQELSSYAGNWIFAYGKHQSSSASKFIQLCHVEWSLMHSRIDDIVYLQVNVLLSDDPWAETWKSLSFYEWIFVFNHTAWECWYNEPAANPWQNQEDFRPSRVGISDGKLVHVFISTDL